MCQKIPGTSWTRSKASRRGLQQSIRERRNPRDLAQLTEKTEQNAKMGCSTILGWAGALHLQPSPKLLSENRPPTLETRRTVWTVIHSPLTAETIQHSKLGELTDDLPRGPAASGRPSGDQQRPCWLQEAEERPEASLPFTSSQSYSTVEH